MEMRTASTAPVATGSPASAESLYLDLMKKVLTRYGFEGAYAAPVLSHETPGRIPYTPGQRLLVPYLHVLKRILNHYGFGNVYVAVEPRDGHYDFHLKQSTYHHIRKLISTGHIQVLRRVRFDPRLREEGKDWPADAETMVGLRRLDNIQYCVEKVLRQEVPGDLIETGVWRGGSTIFMRALLKVYGDTERKVWVADSFQGLPKSNPEAYPEDCEFDLSIYPELAVSLDQVKANFSRYGLLDDQVCFLVGWFRDTLPGAPIERLALLRLDGDLYESTMDALRALYPKLSPGGYVIIDDYGAVPPCKSAVDEYRAEYGITEPLEQIDWSGVFWRKR